MNETQEKLIKKIEGKGYQRALNFIDKRVKELKPYNWNKYKYFIFDAETPEYGLSIGYYNDRIINMVFDTSNDRPVMFYHRGIIIHVEDLIDEPLCVRIHSAFALSQYVTAIDTNLLLNYAKAAFTIEIFNKKIYNVVPLNRRNRLNMDNAFTRLDILSKIQYEHVGCDLLPFSKHIEAMYNDIIA